MVIECETRRILAVNPALEEMSGFSEKEMLGKICHDFVCASDIARCPILDLGVCLEHSERRLLRKDKPSLPILKSAIPVQFDGKAAVLETISDLSEQQNLIKTIFQTIPDMIWMKNLDGVYQLCNPAFETFFGEEESKIIGKTDFDFVDPELAAFFQSRDQEAQLAGRPCRNEERVQYASDGHIAFLETTKTPVYNHQGKVIGTLGIAHDITRRKEVELRLERNTLVQTALRNISEATMTRDSIGSFYELTAKIIERLFPGCGFFITLVDEQNASLYSPYVNDPWGILRESRPLSKGFREYVLQERKAVILQGSAVASLYEKGWLELRLPEQSQWLGCPLIQEDGKPIGVTGLFFIGEEHLFSEDDLEVFSVAAANLSVTMERLKAEKSLRESYHKLLLAQEATVRILSNTAEIKDAYTAGHQRRVAELTCAIAKRMGLDSEDFLRMLKMAALIHDIGKISVPSEILSKPGTLSTLEFELIKLHSQVGYQLLREETISAEIANIIYQHHERLDGSGYPNGLKDGAICKEARIIAVADVVEAMSSFRPYRPALGMDRALDEIVLHSGTLFDVEVVEACVSIIRDGSFQFSE